MLEAVAAQESAGLTDSNISRVSLDSVLSKPASATLPLASPLPGTETQEIKAGPECPEQTSARLRGVRAHPRRSPAIGCDVTSVVSGESREGEQESEQAAGGRAGGTEGGSERTSSE